MIRSLITLIVILSIHSCYNIQINENEAGVHFKRFDGGVDTSNFLDTGTHNLPNWDRVILYDTSIKSNSVEHQDEKGYNYEINYSFYLPKVKAPRYHNRFGGDPTIYSERVILDILSKSDTTLINTETNSIDTIFFKGVFSRYYLMLMEMDIKRIE